MRILVLTPRYPYPLVGGDKIRIYHIIKVLKEAGHELTLLSFVENQQETSLAQEKELTDIFFSIHTAVLPKWRSHLNAFWGLIRGKPLQTSYYHSKEMQSLVDKEFSMGDYDAVLVHLIRMAPYVIGRSGVYKVLEMTDALSLNYQRSREQGSKGFLGKVYAIEEKRARDYERECIKRFDATVVVSNVDRDYLVRETGEEAQKKVRVVPHGAQDAFFQKITNNYEPDLIVFIGNLRTHQNNDAVLYFVQKIYPRIKAQQPKAKFRIVGADPSNNIKLLDKKNGIEVTGKLESVYAYIRDACVSVAPIRIGAGVQGKVLESMAMGVPVVATSIAVKGIEGGMRNEHFLVADEPKAFADAVLELMNDKSKRSALVRRAKKLAERYRYSRLAREYAKIFV